MALEPSKVRRATPRGVPGASADSVGCLTPAAAASASRVGIIPFAVQTADPVGRRLATDIADQIGATLADGQVPVLSSHIGVTNTAALADAGRDLGAELLIDGAVRGTANDLEVMVRLNNAK